MRMSLEPLPSTPLLRSLPSMAFRGVTWRSTSPLVSNKVRRGVGFLVKPTLEWPVHDGGTYV